MAIVFTCPNCRQQLEAEASMAGTSINCPACGVSLLIPEPDPANVKVSPPVATAAHGGEKHFSVPTTAAHTDVLIEKPKRPLEVAAKDSEKLMRIKCIKRTECVEVGKDHFDEVVSEFLNKIGEKNVVSINTLNYTHVDMGTRQVLTDYGVMIVYRG